MRKGSTSKSQGRPKFRKKHKPGSRGWPECQKNASLETGAGQNTKKCKNKFKKQAKTCNTMQKHLQKTANATGNGQFFSFLVISAMPANFCFFCIFFVPVSKVALFLHVFFCILAGRGFQACVFFCILVVLSPKKCKKNAEHNSSTPATHQKCKAKFKQASKHENNANSKCKKNATQKKCKQQMQKKGRRNAKDNSKHMPSLWPKDSSNVTPPLENFCPSVLGLPHRGPFSP